MKDKLPKGWKIIKLEKAYIVKDGTHDSPKYIEDGEKYALATSKNLKTGILTLDNVKYISKTDFDKINKRSKVDKGDLLFAMIGTIGNPVFIDFNPNFAIKNMALFKPKKDTYTIEYLKHYLTSPYAINKMENEAKGATQKFVGLTYLRNFPISIPPLPEQKRIVQKLDSLFANIDQALSLVAANLETIPKLKAALLDKAFKGQLFSQVALAKNGLPKGWKMETVENISNFIKSGFACSKKHEKENGYVHLRTHNINTSGQLNFDTFIKIDESKIDKNKAKILKNDIIFNNTNSQELVGKTCIVDRDYNYGYSNHLTRIRTNDDVEPKLVVYYFNQLLHTGYFSRICKRWIGQAGINQTKLKAIKIPLPPLPKQKQIVQKLDQAFAEIDQLEAQYQAKQTELEQLKKSLLDRAFKGKL